MDDGKSITFPEGGLPLGEFVSFDRWWLRRPPYTHVLIRNADQVLPREDVRFILKGLERPESAERLPAGG